MNKSLHCIVGAKLSRTEGAEHLGGLGGHLDARLQDGDGEVRVGRGAEPQPEVGVRLLHRQLLHQLVQFRHPGQRQVAVGEEDPVTCREVEVRGQMGGECMRV